MAPPSFYIASSRDRIGRIGDVRGLAAILERMRMRNAFAWPDHFDHQCSEEVCGIRDRNALAEQELFAASRCDLFIGLARLGKGSHVELGAALTGTKKRIILVGVDRSDLVFYDNAKVKVVDEDRFRCWYSKESR